LAVPVAATARLENRMLARAKRLTVDLAAASPDWQVITPFNRAGPGSRCRFNSAFRQARDRSAYPVAVDVAVALSRVSSTGSPVLPRPGDLAAVEAAAAQAVTNLAGGGVALVATITGPTSVEFVLYAAGQPEAAEAEQVLRATLDGHHVSVATSSDPRWKVYGLLAREKRRNRVGRVVLVLVPLLFGAVVYAHYGRWWGLGEAVACAAWLGPLLVPGRARGPARKQAARPSPLGWKAVVGVGALASSFFSLVTLFAGQYLTAVESFAIAAAAGLLVTAALWPAQRRHSAMMRSRVAEEGNAGNPGT
jgi:hypothetical protein